MEFKFSKAKVIFQLIVAVVFMGAGIVTLIMAQGREEPVPPPPNHNITQAPPQVTERPPEVVTTIAEVVTDEPPATTDQPDPNSTEASPAETTAPPTATDPPVTTAAEPTGRYTRVMSLGAFNAVDIDGNQRGWETDGVISPPPSNQRRSSPYTIAQFTAPRYLVLELEEIPEGTNNLSFAWRSSANSQFWHQTRTDVADVEDNLWVIDLRLMKGGTLFNTTNLTNEGLELIVWVSNLDWGSDVILKEAYFAN
jgi:hypothetical protein